MPLIFYWSYWQNQLKNKEIVLEFLRDTRCAWHRDLLLDKIVSLRDIEIEASVRRFLYHLIFWTGNQDPGNPYIDSVVDLIRWHTKNRDANNGRGPQWACGPMSALYVGILAALEIPARRVWVSSNIPGDLRVDCVAEFWSSYLNQWVLVEPHHNGHFELYGKRLSAQEWAKADRNKNYPDFVTIDSHGEAKHIVSNLARLRDMSGRVMVMCGNRPHAGWGNLKPSYWNYVEVLPSLDHAPKLTSNKVIPYEEAWDVIINERPPLLTDPKH